MKKSVAILCVFLLIIGLCASVSAQASLQFTAERVYWDSPYRLAVEGYFKNTGDQTITAINHFDVTVLYENRYTGEYLYLGQGAWTHNPKLEQVYLEPEQISKWTFYLKTDKYPTFQYWSYRWYVEYKYQN
jgi:hypothetical protein